MLARSQPPNQYVNSARDMRVWCSLAQSPHLSAALFVPFMGIGIMLFIAGLASWAPLGFSIATVYLFAVPHNLLEARYFLARTPYRWKPLQEYFLVAIGGILGLGAIFAALPWVARASD